MAKKKNNKKKSSNAKGRAPISDDNPEVSNPAADPAETEENGVPDPVCTAPHV